MKALRFVAAAVLAAASATSVSATSIVVNPVVDLSTATSNPATGYLSVQLTGDPVELHAGDIVTGHLSFANGDQVQIADNHFIGFAEEQVMLELFDPIEGAEGGRADSVYTFSFTGVTGDYIGGYNTPGGWNGAVGAGAFADLTNSSFTFDGIDFSITLRGGTSTQFVPGTLRAGPFGAASVVPGAVPEPATWAMMLLGFAAIGFQVRRQSRRAGLSPA